MFASGRSDGDGGDGGDGGGGGGGGDGDDNLGGNVNANVSADCSGDGSVVLDEELSLAEQERTLLERTQRDSIAPDPRGMGAACGTAPLSHASNENDEDDSLEFAETGMMEIGCPPFPPLATPAAAAAAAAAAEAPATREPATRAPATREPTRIDGRGIAIMTDEKGVYVSMVPSDSHGEMGKCRSESRLVVSSGCVSTTSPTSALRDMTMPGLNLHEADNMHIMLPGAWRSPRKKQNENNSAPKHIAGEQTSTKNKSNDSGRSDGHVITAEHKLAGVEARASHRRGSRVRLGTARDGKRNYDIEMKEMSGPIHDADVDRGGTDLAEPVSPQSRRKKKKKKSTWWSWLCAPFLSYLRAAHSGDIDSVAKRRILYANNPGLNAKWEFLSNYVRTTQYTLLSFLPLNLKQQLGKAANFYFFIVAILVSLPSVSNIAPWTNWTPLVFVLSVTALREGLEDYSRYKDDIGENSRHTHVLRDGLIQKLPWHRVVVGDIVRIREGEFFPADMVVLSSSDRTGRCSVETSNLDGETALKFRSALQPTMHLRHRTDVVNLRGCVHCELPNANLHYFEGIWIDDKTDETPITQDQLLLRGTVLMNTRWVYGLVIYTGGETKLYLNLNDPVHKRTQIEIATNHHMYKIFMLLFSMCVFLATVLGATRRNRADEEWYLGFDVSAENRVAWYTLISRGMRDWAAFLVLFSLMVPISLYVSMELVRLVQTFMFNWDLEMYDAESDTPAVCRTAALNEQLGEIEYVFCDKTGTLTENQMAFAKCSVGGVLYGSDTTSNGDTPSSTRRRFSYINPIALDAEMAPSSPRTKLRFDTGVRRMNSMSFPEFKLFDLKLMKDIHEERESVIHFLLCLALCHSVTPLREKDRAKRKRHDGDRRASLESGLDEHDMLDSAHSLPASELTNAFDIADATADATANASGNDGKAHDLSARKVQRQSSRRIMITTKHGTHTVQNSQVADRGRATEAMEATEATEATEAAAIGMVGDIRSSTEHGVRSHRAHSSPNYYPGGDGSALHSVPNGDRPIFAAGAFSDPGYSSSSSSDSEDDECGNDNDDTGGAAMSQSRSLEYSTMRGVGNVPDHVNLHQSDMTVQMRVRHRSEMREARRSFNASLRIGYMEDVQYQSSSPDEMALVVAARCMGYFFHTRDRDRIVIRTPFGDREFTLLKTIDFTSERRRMSVLVRCPDGSVRLYCKGAESAVYKILSDSRYENPVRILRETMDHLNGFSKRGLRVMCVAWKHVSEPAYADWASHYDKASRSIGNRKAKMERVAMDMERNLLLLGATAIEDKLQEGVPQAIAQLRQAGMKVWILTGDKQETAVNIGKSCRLISNLDLFYVATGNGPTVQQNRKASLMVQNIVHMERAGMPSAHRELTEHEKHDMKEDAIRKEMPRRRQIVAANLARILKSFQEREAAAQEAQINNSEEDDKLQRAALIVDGMTLALALAPQVEDMFLSVIKHPQCRVVVCARLAPKQKAAVVELVKKGLGAITLAIGDGANDVSMIQAAHVGVGISGREGMQAVNASDYAVAQFRFLARLLLVHGRWSYVRNSLLVFYMFYKNIAISFVQLWFVFQCGFSDQEVFDGVLLNTFNLFHTSLPILFWAVLDRDIDADVLMKYPELYRDRPEFSPKHFWAWCFLGIAHSAVVYHIPTFALANAGMDSFWSSSFAVYTALVVIVSAKLGAAANSWTIFQALVLGISVLFWFVFASAYNSYTLRYFESHAYNVFFKAMREPSIWFAMLMVGLLGVLPDLLWKYVERQFFTRGRHVIRERAVLGMPLIDRSYSPRKLVVSHQQHQNQHRDLEHKEPC